MKFLLVVFAVVAVAAAYPDVELARERRGIIAGAPLVSTIVAKPALLAPAPIAVASPIAVGGLGVPLGGLGLGLGGPLIKTIG